MTVLLTGSAGFLGKNLLRRLQSHRVFCYQRDGALPSIHIDLVIHAAAEMSDPTKMVDTNVGLTRRLLDLALDHGSRFIQIGTSSETGPIEGLRSETTFCQPSNMYEATKLAATNLVLGYAAQYGLDACVARPFSLYGPGDKPRMMLPTLWRCFCEHVPFNGAPAGHDWLHVDDFVAGILALALAPTHCAKGQLYHFGTGVNTSNEQVVKLFQSFVGSGLTVNWSNARLKPWDVNDWRADWTKARDQLGWSPKVTLEAGIRDYVYDLWFNPL